MDSDSEEIETMFLTFFAGIKHFLSSSSSFSELRGLMNSISMPGIDHHIEDPHLALCTCVYVGWKSNHNSSRINSGNLLRMMRSAND